MLFSRHSRHGMETAELRARWGIAVWVFSIHGLGLVVMVLVRVFERSHSPFGRSGSWSRNLFAARWCREHRSDSDLLGQELLLLLGMSMALSWVTFVFEFIRNQRPHSVTINLL